MKGFFTADLSRYANFDCANPTEEERRIWGDEAPPESIKGLRCGELSARFVPFLFAGEKAARLIALRRHPGCFDEVTVKIGKRADYIVFAHFVQDIFSGIAPRELKANPGRLIARYEFIYSDGRAVSQDIKSAFEISEHKLIPGIWFRVGPFNAWAGAGHRAGDTYNDRPWGRAQMGLRGEGALGNFTIFVWKNPRPRRTIKAIRLISEDVNPVFIGAITLYRGKENPLHLTPRAELHLSLEKKPEKLEIGIDRGEVVRREELAAVPRDFLKQKDIGWLNTDVRPNGKSILLEAYANKDAELTIRSDGDSLRAKWRDVMAGKSVRSRKRTIAVRRVYPEKVWVEVEVVDAETKTPTPARVHFCTSEGVYLPPYGHPSEVCTNWFEHVGGDVRLGGRNYAYINGRFSILLPTGTVYVEVVKGFEYAPLRKRLEIRPTRRRIRLPIGRWVDMKQEGYYCGDTHIHFLSTEVGYLEAQAEGLNVANILAAQWGKLFTNVPEISGEPSRISDDETIVFVNTENRHHILGHLILLGAKMPCFPLSSGGPTEDYLAGTEEISMSAWTDMCHAQGGLVIAPHFPSPNCELPAEIVMGKIDAIEFPRSSMFVNEHRLREWYRYLNLGYRLPCVGGTDKMSNGISVGYIRTYADIGDRPFTYENWCRAIKEGRSFASLGPVLSFTIDGKGMGSTIRMKKSGGTVEIEATGRSARPFDSIQVVENGRVIAEARTNSSKTAASIRQSHKVSDSAWYAARCIRRMGNLDLVVAHSSPIYVYLDKREIFSLSDATYLLTLMEGGISYCENIGSFRNEKKRLEIKRVFERAHAELHRRMKAHIHK